MSAESKTMSSESKILTLDSKVMGDGVEDLGDGVERLDDGLEDHERELPRTEARRCRAPERGRVRDGESPSGAECATMSPQAVMSVRR
jgi:hypothetical protein